MLAAALLLLVLPTRIGAPATAACTQHPATDYQAPGSKCPASPCSDLGGTGGGFGFGAADAQACCQLCADYPGPEVCKYAVFQPAGAKDKNCFLKAAPADPKLGGAGNLGLVLQSQSSWGGGLLMTVALLCVAYVGGGVLLGRASGKVPGLAAHPHYHRWVELLGLVRDGGAHAGLGGRSSSTERRGGYRPVGEPAARSDGRKKPKEKRSKAKGRKEKASSPAPAPAAQVSAAASAPASNAKATEGAGKGSAAGDGGRWVHVPN